MRRSASTTCRCRRDVRVAAGIRRRALQARAEAAQAPGVVPRAGGALSTMADDDAGFLSRWSRRKARCAGGAGGRVPTPVELPPRQLLAVAMPAALPMRRIDAAAVRADVTSAAGPPPTLADVAALTRDSDYTRFVAPGVERRVKNAALKKLFTDPHFNVMDGLDTYIDDYNTPDPLPARMLRQMVQAASSACSTERQGREPRQPRRRAAAEPATAQAEAARSTAPHFPRPRPDEDTDLRLQPHDAAGRPGPEPGAAADGPGASSDGLEHRPHAAVPARGRRVPARRQGYRRAAATSCWSPARRSSACSSN